MSQSWPFKFHLRMENVSNPWAAEEAETQALRNILGFANGLYGYQVPSRTAETNQMTSLQLIDRLQQRSRAQKELRTVSSELQRRLMDKESSDITHTDVLESKISSISELNGLLQDMLERKQELVTRLQKPLVGDNLRVEAAHHEHVRKLFPQIAQHLAQLNQNLDTMEWSKDFSQTDEQLERTLAGKTGKLVQIQAELQDIAQLRDRLQSIQASGYCL